MQIKRRSPIRHKRKPYIRKDGTKVKGTIVNPDYYIKTENEKKIIGLWEKGYRPSSISLITKCSRTEISEIITNYRKNKDIQKEISKLARKIQRIRKKHERIIHPNEESMINGLMELQRQEKEIDDKIDLLIKERNNS